LTAAKLRKQDASARSTALFVELAPVAHIAATRRTARTIARPLICRLRRHLLPACGEKGHAAAVCSLWRSEPPLICRLRRHLLPARGEKGRTTAATLVLAQRAAPHLSASPTSSPRVRGEGARDCGHAHSRVASRPSSVGFADIFSPHAGEGARVTPSSAAARCGCARGRRRRRAACGIRRASRGSRRSPAPSARRCRPASPRTAAGSLRSFPAPHR